MVGSAKSCNVQAKLPAATVSKASRRSRAVRSSKPEAAAEVHEEAEKGDAQDEQLRVDPASKESLQASSESCLKTEAKNI